MMVLKSQLHPLMESRMDEIFPFLRYFRKEKPKPLAFRQSLL
jgi:hypothetical protein